LGHGISSFWVVILGETIGRLAANLGRVLLCHGGSGVEDVMMDGWMERRFADGFALASFFVLAVLDWLD